MGWKGYKNKSAQKVDPEEDNSPAACAGTWTQDLAITSSLFNHWANIKEQFKVESDSDNKSQNSNNTEDLHPILDETKAFVNALIKEMITGNRLIWNLAGRQLEKSSLLTPSNN